MRWNSCPRSRLTIVHRTLVRSLFCYKNELTGNRIGSEMKSLYWLVQRHMKDCSKTDLVSPPRCHNHLFPNIRPLPCNAIPEIKDILIHAVGGM